MVTPIRRCATFKLKKEIKKKEREYYKEWMVNTGCDCIDGAVWCYLRTKGYRMPDRAPLLFLRSVQDNYRICSVD